MGFLSANSLRLRQPYNIWRFENRTIIFNLNGRELPAELPANAGIKLRPNIYAEELNQIASKFWNIPANDIVGIEVLDSSEYLRPYFRGNEGNERPLYVIVTTHSGSTDLERTRIGTTLQYQRGFSVPKSFYVPKYYPENIIDQAEYDVKPTLYWNPEVVTDRNGVAEIQFPVGTKPRGLQIRVEGIDQQGGIGSAMEGIVIGEQTKISSIN